MTHVKSYSPVQNARYLLQGNLTVVGRRPE